MKEEENKPTVQENQQPVLLKWYKHVMPELPKILPVIYLFTIGIGMLFNYYKYQYFGINIFQYASVFDFLISPFEDYIILLFTFFSLAFCSFVYFIDCWMERKIPKVYNLISFNLNKNKKYPAARAVLYFFLILVYCWIAAIFYGGYSYKKTLKQEDIHVVYYNNETISGKQIGKTTSVLFLFQSEGKTKAIPINSLVKEIQYTTFYP